MAGRIRTVKPEWLSDERLLEAGSDSRVLSIALILLADDSGRGRVTVVTAATIFPQDSRVFNEALARLRGWFVRLYAVRGQRYFELVNWRKHQRIDKPSKPHTPEPSEGEYLDEAADGPARDSREPEPSRESRGTLAPDLDLDLDLDLRPTTVDVDRDARARAPAPAHPRTRARESDRDHERRDDVVREIRDPAILAIRAYRDAIERPVADGGPGGIFDGGQAYRQAFDAVGRLAARVVERDGGTVDATLGDWASRYVAERRSRRPDWWHEWLTKRLAQGPARTVSSEPDEPHPQVLSLNEEANLRSDASGAKEREIVARRGLKAADGLSVREAARWLYAQLTAEERAAIKQAGDDALDAARTERSTLIADWTRRHGSGS